MREALFSIIGQDLSGESVFDPFGGTGLLSFEALSRGAERALILERDPGALRQIREAAAALGFSDRVELRRGSAPADLPKEGAFSLIFLDPPYRMDPGPLIEAVLPLALDRVVLEHSAQTPAPTVQGLGLERTRVYGDTCLTLYQREL